MLGYRIENVAPRDIFKSSLKFGPSVQSKILLLKVCKCQVGAELIMNVLETAHARR